MLKSFAKQTYRGKPVRTKKESNVKRIMTRFFVFGVLIVFGLILWRGVNWVQNPQKISFQGKIMGESFTVTCYGVSPSKRALIEKAILKQVDDSEHVVSASLYQSELARFNTSTNTDVKVVSPAFFKLFTFCEQLYHKSNGAWDGAGRLPAIASQDIQMNQRGGFYKVALIKPNLIQKTDPGITLNLSALAYGYVIDQIASELQESGVKTFSIQLENHMLVSGSEKYPWVSEKNQLVFKLDNQAISMDSRTIVIADTAILADGLLAAVKNLSTQDSAKLLAAYPRAKGFFILKIN